jgi:hypothetical protein
MDKKNFLSLLKARLGLTFDGGDEHTLIASYPKSCQPWLQAASATATISTLG